MNCCKRKENEDEESYSDQVFDRSKIYFDVNGNLIYNPEAFPFEREYEMRQLLEIDPGDPKVSDWSMFFTSFDFTLLFRLITNCGI